MSSVVSALEGKKLAHPPRWLSANICYETIMGSNAYGVSSDNSDFDVYGFCVPPKNVVFPHLSGVIFTPKRKGKGEQGSYGVFGHSDVERFAQYQEHHIFDQTAAKGKGIEYDLNVFNIVRYFELLMENNPNMLDSIFTPHECVLHSTAVGNMVRENRLLFLHKGLYAKFKGYAYSQLHKMHTKEPEEGSKRKKIRDEFGFDVKYAMHLVRLLDECEQLLLYCDMDMRRNKEQLKAIRRGEISEKEIRKWASDKESQLEKTFADTKLPDPPKHNPSLEKKIRQLLLDCLEHHYGNIENCVVNPDKASLVISQIKGLIEDL